MRTCTRRSSGRRANDDIFAIRGRGAGLINLANDPAEDGVPAWSPDGKLIAFWTDGVAVQNDPGIAVALTLR
jgi:Tol biopolymer transport system component